STKLKKGERVLLDTFDAPQEMIVALIRSVRSKGALPFVNLQSNLVARELLKGAEEDQYRTVREFEMARMKMMDAYIALRGSNNTSEFSDIPPERMQLDENASTGCRPAAQQDEVGCFTLANLIDGANGRHEHRSVRGFFFQGLHTRLREDETRHGGAEIPDGNHGPCPYHWDRNRSAVQHPRHSCNHVRRRT